MGFTILGTMPHEQSDGKKRERKSTIYDMNAYSLFRRAELAEHVAKGLVAGDATLAFEMHLLSGVESTGVNKTGTLFFTSEDKRHGVAVLFMPPRQELTVAEGHVSMKKNPWENEEMAEDAFETYGILDTQSSRPSISRVQNVFTQSKEGLFENDKLGGGENAPVSKKQKQKKKKRIHNDLEEWRQKRAKGLPGTTASTPAHGTSATRPQTPSSQMVSDSGVASNLERTTSFSSTFMSPSPHGKVVSFQQRQIQFQGSQLTLSISHVRDELHLDISPRDDGQQLARDVVEYPYAHDPIELYKARGNTMKRSVYGNIYKKDWVLKCGRSVEVKTFRQIREEDVRHLERLVSEHEWRGFSKRILLKY